MARCSPSRSERPLARGQFARVPVINGITHDEELLFVAGLGLTVSQGTNIPLAGNPMNPANYQANIVRALGVSPARAAAIANEYPLSAYPSPVVAFSLLVADASFACPALQVDRWTTARGVPTYAYQFNDDNAPLNIVGSGLGLATHGTELPYLFDQPNTPFPCRAQPRPAGARRQHADGLGQLRRQRQPVVARTALAADWQRDQG